MLSRYFLKECYIDCFTKQFKGPVIDSVIHPFVISNVNTENFSQNSN